VFIDIEGSTRLLRPSAPATRPCLGLQAPAAAFSFRQGSPASPTPGRRDLEPRVWRCCTHSESLQPRWPPRLHVVSVVPPRVRLSNLVQDTLVRWPLVRERRHSAEPGIGCLPSHVSSGRRFPAAEVRSSSTLWSTPELSAKLVAHDQAPETSPLIQGSDSNSAATSTTTNSDPPTPGHSPRTGRPRKLSGRRKCGRRGRESRT